MSALHKNVGLKDYTGKPPYPRFTAAWKKRIWKIK